MRRRGPGSRGMRGIAVAAVTVLAAGFAAYGGAAGAVPRPTISQVQAEVKIDKIGQQYVQVSGRVSAARGRLGAVRLQAGRDQAQFSAAQKKLAQVVVAAYEGSAQTSAAGLLTSGDPAAVLSRASLLEQLAKSQRAQATQLLARARQVTQVRQELQRTEYGIATLQTQLAGQKAKLAKLLVGKQATLDSLTAAQQEQVAANAVGAGGTTAAVYTGPTNTQAEKAVAFAYAQLGKPYVWGATGPGSYDCSGLTMASWAAAGVSIPRTSYSQWAGLPHVPTSQLQPGDILVFDGVGHVALYVGGGYLIDAPHSGAVVEKVALTGWYSQSVIGAVRP
jgi:peptidoglycan DL-endopeptidase CwlO